MIEPGDVVTVDFRGATGVKRRPTVVVFIKTYPRERPDFILGVLTSNLRSANASSDYHLHDWLAAGLQAPSAFRAYFGMAEHGNVRRLGPLSKDDWHAVQRCVQIAFATPDHLK